MNDKDAPLLERVQASFVCGVEPSNVKLKEKKAEVLLCWSYMKKYIGRGVVVRFLIETDGYSEAKAQKLYQDTEWILAPMAKVDKDVTRANLIDRAAELLEKASQNAELDIAFQCLKFIATISGANKHDDRADKVVPDLPALVSLSSDKAVLHNQITPNEDFELEDENTEE